MGVTKKGFDSVREKVKSDGLISDEAMILRLSYIGDQICTHARTVTPDHQSGGYDDQSHNLRSSISFGIFKDGMMVKSGGFKDVGGSEGIEASRTAINKFSQHINVQGWTLLVVAGMDYAQYVEDKGYNVLFLSKIELDKKIQQLKAKLGL